MNGRGKVYFEPDTNVKLVYPCLIYSISNEEFSYTSNKIYTSIDQYDVTIIDKNPDSTIPKDLVDFGFSRLRFDRSYVYENLHHTVYKLYF